MDRNMDPDVDMMDIDDDFSDDELDAYFQAHGLDEELGPYRRVSSQHRPQERVEQQWQPPPPSAQREFESSDLEQNYRGGNSRWKRKGKADRGETAAVDDELELDTYFQAHGLSEDLEPYQPEDDRPPPSYQPRPQRQPPRSSGLKNSRWKGKGNAVGHGNAAGLGNPAGFGRGDVLGRDGGARDGGKGKVQAWLLDEGDKDGDDDDERDGEAVYLYPGAPPGKSGRPQRVISPSPSPDPTLGSSPPVLSGLSIHNKDNDDTAPPGNKKTAASQTREEEGQGEAAPIDDPYDSEVSIAARPIVSHDPDYPNRPIDSDVKAARGVIRHVLVSEKFPEVWPDPEAEAEAEEEVEGQQKAAESGKVVVEGVKVVEGQKNGPEKEKESKQGKQLGQKALEKEKEKKGADNSKEEYTEKKKEVVIPKGVVMLVRGIQFLKMPPDTPSGSEVEVCSQYGYEGDSQQRGSSTPPSEFWSDEELRAHGNEGQKHERVRDDDDDSEHSVERPWKELPQQEIQETDLSASNSQPSSTNNDSDIPMTNADYLPPPSSQIPPPHSQPHRQSQSQVQSSISLKRTWSQRQDHDHPSSPSSPSDPDPDPYHDDLYNQNLPPPLRPPSSSSSLPSQPPTGPPNLLIRLLLDDGEFWVQAILRPEFHHLVLGYDFDEWASDSDSEPEDDLEEGEGAKEEEEREQEMQEKWQTKWEEKARGEVREGIYVRLVGEVVVEFEEVDVDDELQPQPQPQPMKNDQGVSKGQEKEKGFNEVNGRQAGGVVKGGVKERGERMHIYDDGIGDPEKMEKLKREAMERKWLGKGKEDEGLAKVENAGAKTEVENPKTGKMVCLVVGHMVPVGWDRKYMREMKKAQLKAMEEELGPDSEVSSTTGDEMDVDTKDDKSKKKKKEPVKQKPWWMETGYRAELEEKRKREAQKLAKEVKEREHISDQKLQNAAVTENKRPDPRKVLPPEWANLSIFEVDRLLKEWDKQNKPKEPKPPKPPKPVKKPIITARQAPQFRSSITAQEIFQLQNPDRKPPTKAPGPVYLAAEARALRGPQEVRQAAIENNQQIQRKIKELPPRPQPRPQQEPGPRPHLQPHPLLQPPQARPQARPQAQVQPHPQPQPQLRPQPQLQPQPPRPQPQPQLPPQPPARPHFQPQAQARPQFLQQQPPPKPQPQPQPQAQPQHPPRLPPQPPLPPPKPNPHLATDPTVPLKLCSLRQIPHLPYAQNWMVNVLAVIVSISDVEPSPMPPTYTQRIVRLADQSTSKLVLLNVFLDAEEFNPRPGEVVLLMGVKNHRFEGGCLKKYWSDRPPEGCKVGWWVGEEVLGGLEWCRGVVDGLRGWWREREEREREREEEGE
ncbi:hypothetical protein B0H65DRAFT_492909, partial [Neurospora tetraspora]